MSEYQRYKESHRRANAAFKKRAREKGLCVCGKRKPWLRFKSCRRCVAAKVRNRKLKLTVIAGYGGKCVCCGERHPDFLTLDHKKGRGNSHRKILYGSSRGGYTLYLWVVKHNFPKKKYQLLCWNCNCAKGSFGTCPHKRRKHVAAYPGTFSK